MDATAGKLPADGAAPSPLDLLEDYRTSLTLRASGAQVRRDVRLLKRFFFQQGIFAVAGLNAQPIERYLADLAAKGRAPKTLQNHLVAISGFCEFLIGRGLLIGNPCRHIRLARPPERLPRWLEPDEVRQVLAVARRAGIWPDVSLALTTGLRLSELARLRWTDVDIDRRLLVVRKSKSRRPRSVPLCRCALLALRAQRHDTGGHEYVFPARRTYRGGWRYADGPRSSRSWLRALRPVQEAVRKFRWPPGRATGRGWHLFRHTFASRLAQQGVSLYKIAQWLGHSDVRTTRIYAHLQQGFDPDIELASPLEPSERAGKGERS